MIQDIIEKPILILGCGNILFGDDGFGPKVIEHLETNFSLPETVWAQDMGTGLRDFLFDLMLSPIKPKHIFILDTMCLPDRKAGELFEIDLAKFPKKTGSSPFHQFPSISQIQEIEGLTGVDIRILGVQAKEIPDTVRPGLSPEVKEAVPRACEWLVNEIGSGTSPQ
jgi:coenzyme F420 hydrogenase subunit delta